MGVVVGGGVVLSLLLGCSASLLGCVDGGGPSSNSGGSSCACVCVHQEYDYIININ